MDDPSTSYINVCSIIQLHADGFANPTNWLMVLLLIVLLILAAFISAAEVAYFSLTPSLLEQLKRGEDATSKLVLNHLQSPKKLIATFLIAINLVNIGVVILSSSLINNPELIVFESESVKFIFQVVIVTFLILIIGEVVPKIYASLNALSLVKLMSIPLNVATKVFKPLSSVLVGSTAYIEKRFTNKQTTVSVADLSHALELTHDNSAQEKSLLKGIVKFGSTEARQVMTPRINLIAFDNKLSFEELVKNIEEKGFSRVPIYEDSIENIVGILHIKDLLKHLNNPADLDWNNLLRPVYFIPENKKIDDLLKEFQTRKIHIALVVDEYGGTSGLITFDDVIEEIVGEINDEFDEEDIFYSKLDDNNYLFEAKTSINDVCKVLKIDSSQFDRVKADADTLGGFILEMEGRIPLKNEYINFENYTFTIESADRRKIKRVKIEIHPVNEVNTN
ncbi:MAG: gliding motility-associated protein GldE [Bacteroidia bacterium]|nr:gliding motility-associated protein GldE [Bacteroidia bacterium]